jgi:hypothetical protein
MGLAHTVRTLTVAMLTALVAALSSVFKNPSRPAVGKLCAPVPAGRSTSLGQEAEVDPIRPALVGLALRSVG